jgi:thiosulfate/3-mercaptopyruvate sulfurtransferase
MMAATLGDPVLSVEALERDPDAFRVVDVRWYLDGRSGQAAFDAGHIPGAVFCDLDLALAGHGAPTAGRHPLPTPAAFAAALGALGIAAADQVVAYDDTGGGTAGRLVWMLRAIGQRAAILDGGLAAWHGERSTTASEPTPVAREAVAWPPAMLEELADLDALSGTDVVLDARAAERYGGAVEPVDPRAGHIPLASNLPWTSLLGDDGRLAPAEELREAFQSVGIESAGDLVASCGSGVTACMLLIAAEHAGLGSGRLFVPSFSGWSSSARDVATS